MLQLCDKKILTYLHSYDVLHSYLWPYNKHRKENRLPESIICSNFDTKLEGFIHSSNSGKENVYA